MKKVLSLAILIFMSVLVFAQYDSLWTQTYGGADYDYCYDIIETSDSCYLLGGYTSSYGAGSIDFWLVKTNMDGDTLWTKTYGGFSLDFCNSIIETSDSCYLLGGSTESYGAGNADFWLIKTDASGDTLWTKTYGGSSIDYCYSIIETSDSCYLLGGYTYSYGAGNEDFWLIKTDASGDTLWTQTYGGSSTDFCYSIIETSDSCYLLGGYTQSYGAGNADCWLIKTDASGDTLWTQTYGGVQSDKCRSIIETSDSCYLLGGYTISYGAGNADCWLIKTDASGDTLWTQTYGGVLNDYCHSIKETCDSCYLLGGATKSFGAGNADFWIIKADTHGDTLWTQAYGGVQDDKCQSIIETSDSCYLLGGYTSSYGAGGYDCWLVKIADIGIADFSIIPNYNNYIATDSVSIYWHPSDCKIDLSYELNINNTLDTISQSDTMFIMDNYPEGQYIWYINAINDYGIRVQSDNADTFWIDRTIPAVLAVEEIKDTNFCGPYELKILAEDTMAGIDSIAINYMLPGESVWSRVLTTEHDNLWYTGYIPWATQTGYAYYYLELYDRAVPSNACRYPAYPDLFSFEITGLTGIEDSPALDYSLNIKQIDNTSICLTLPKDSPVNISLYDINGRAIVKKAMTMPAGMNTINLDVIPGVYFVKLSSPYGNASEKIVNIK